MEGTLHKIMVRFKYCRTISLWWSKSRGGCGKSAGNG